eukprot:2297283-Pyramimonas_sp.AAC.1
MIARKPDNFLEPAQTSHQSLLHWWQYLPVARTLPSSRLVVARPRIARLSSVPIACWSCVYSLGVGR